MRALTQPTAHPQRPNFLNKNLKKSYFSFWSSSRTSPISGLARTLFRMLSSILARSSLRLSSSVVTCLLSTRNCSSRSLEAPHVATKTSTHNHRIVLFYQKDENWSSKDTKNGFIRWNWWRRKRFNRQVLLDCSCSFSVDTVLIHGTAFFRFTKFYLPVEFGGWPQRARYWDPLFTCLADGAMQSTIRKQQTGGYQTDDH